MKDFLKLLINIVTNLAFYGVLVVLFAIVSVVCFALLHILYTLLDGIVVILIPIFIVIGPALLLVFLYLEADEAKNTEKNDNISNV